MNARHEKERLDLQTAHRKETAALARQHIAERLGVHEKWRALYLGRQASRNRRAAYDETRHGSTAKCRRRFHQASCAHRANRRASAMTSALAANPREAARAHFETAHLEAARHEAIRAQLLEKRAQNLERAGIAYDSNRSRSAQRQRRMAAQLQNGGASAEASPKAILMPGIHTARDSRFEKIQERMRDVDPQQQIRQAAASGRTLTSDERANASPEMKERLAREDKKSQERSSFFTGGNSREQDRGKGGRSGGGRGR